MPAPKRRFLTAALGLAVLFALLLPYLRPRPTPRYTVTDLGVLPGDTVSSASGINNHGDIVGLSSKDYATAQIFFYRNGKMTSVGPFKFAGDNGPDIADGGQINHKLFIGSATAQSSYERNLPHHAILYSGSRKIGFTLPPGWTRALLCGVNDSGQVIGNCWRQGIGVHSPGAFVYDSKTRRFSMLPTPPGFQGGLLGGINSHGQIAGVAWNPGYDNSRAVLWNAGQPVLLTGLPGRSENEGLGINNRGEVVGAAGAEPNAAARFVKDYPQRWRLLVPFFQKQWESHAVVYTGGQAQDLNTLIPADADWTLEEANSINDGGQIVGNGLHYGQGRAFLLTPTTH